MFLACFLYIFTSLSFLFRYNFLLSSPVQLSGWYQKDKIYRQKAVEKPTMAGEMEEAIIIAPYAESDVTMPDSSCGVADQKLKEGIWTIRLDIPS